MTVFQKQTNRYFTFGRQPVAGQTGVKGQVLAISEPRQAYKYNINKQAPKVLDFWDAEKTRPKMEVVLDLQTELREPSEDGTADDGRRKIVVTVDYKRGGKLAAIQDAMQAVGADDIEVGAFLALWFTGYDPDSQNSDNPRKLYQANYQRPAAGGGAFQQQEQPPQQQQVAGPPQPPTQQNPYGVNPGLGNPYGAGGDMGQPYGQPQQGLTAQQYQQAAQSLQQGTHPVQQQYQQQAQPPQGGGFDPATQGFNPGTGEVTPTYQPPVPAATQPPQVVQVNVEDVKARIQAGQTPAQISAETGASMEAINGVRNLLTTQPY